MESLQELRSRRLKFQPRRRTSALVENSEQVAELLENIPEFETLFDRKSASDVEALLDAFLSDDDDAESRSSESHRYGKSEETNSVDEAFDQLLT